MLHMEGGVGTCAEGGRPNETPPTHILLLHPPPLHPLSPALLSPPLSPLLSPAIRRRRLENRPSERSGPAARESTDFPPGCRSGDGEGGGGGGGEGEGEGEGEGWA